MASVEPRFPLILNTRYRRVSISKIHAHTRFRIYWLFFVLLKGLCMSNSSPWTRTFRRRGWFIPIRNRGERAEPQTKSILKPSALYRVTKYNIVNLMSCTFSGSREIFGILPSSRLRNDSKTTLNRTMRENIVFALLLIVPRDGLAPCPACTLPCPWNRHQVPCDPVVKAVK